MPRSLPKPLVGTWLAVALIAAAGFEGCRMESSSAPLPAGSEGTARQIEIGDVRWYVDYDAALAVARELDKPLWVHFGEDPG